MTDLELTKKCAEAIGLAVVELAQYPEGGWWFRVEGDVVMERYDPLHDDAQAMALVKKFRIELDWIVKGHGLPYPVVIGTWSACYWDSDPGSENVDLNRAIVECVAHMQPGPHRANYSVTLR